MAKKKIELFIDISNEKDFHHTLQEFENKFICAEIYCHFSGYCTALDRIFSKVKFEWSNNEVVFLRVPADEIQALSRLRNQSEPFYMFIVNQRVTQVFRGLDPPKFEDVVKQELMYYRQWKDDLEFDRQTYQLDEPTPDEMDWINARAVEREQEILSTRARQEARQAARKKHRATLMAPHLEVLDFVLYWPHAIHAHPELYEQWNENNIIMIAREELQLTEEEALDILYSGDAPINEASMHTLLSGKALAICLQTLDPVNMVALVRRILYEDNIKNLDENHRASIQSISAFDYYKTYSPTREEIWKKRKEERKLQWEDEKIRHARRYSEMLRLARQAREEAIEAKKVAKEEKKLELLKAGFEELPEQEEVVEDPDEYFPPAGLPIPGFYSPPNDIAKANGLALLFPKLVEDRVVPTSEFLPPHVLVMVHMYRRHKVIEHIAPFTSGIIHMGIFKASTPYDAKHIAYSVKQFDAMEVNISLDDLKLCFMVTTKVDMPLLELMDFSPIHVSRDTVIGEEECAAMFPVDYGDEYNELEDFVVPKKK
ncbi:uncharacterized protein LOC126374608 [Pectinophora gossypiella]|uniref:uncharacterized protein LOC126374608 n=1 Tax=Pectinophora gossypiella TaxID=13191 RepID=UPI00214F51CA|nr:uncharacterized protein LOC126374608 [Pectinophora gossypiella]